MTRTIMLCCVLAVLLSVSVAVAQESVPLPQIIPNAEDGYTLAGCPGGEHRLVAEPVVVNILRLSCVPIGATPAYTPPVATLTATPTFTQTATITGTPIATAMATPTFTQTATITGTPIATAMATPTAIPTATQEITITMTELNVAVAASTDDSYDREHLAVYGLTGDDVRMDDSDTSSDERYYAGYRFLGVTVPQGATVTAAYVTFTFLAADDPNVNIYANDVDDAVTFANSYGDVIGRTRTTAYVAWDAANLGTGAHNSPDLSDVLNEIFARPGWTSGNALALLTVPHGTAAKLFRVRSYDYNPALAAALHIEYTEAAGGSGALLLQMQQHSLRGGVTR